MINYRLAKEEDAKTLNWLLTLLVRDEKQYDDSIDETFVVTSMYEYYINDKTRFIMVALDDDKIVGYLYGFIKNPNDAYQERVAKLDALFVRAEYRHMGIAKHLITLFQEWVSDNDIKLMEVSVCSANTFAKKLYLELGFNPFKEILIGKIEK